MPYVTPRTWVAGDVLTAAQLNQDVRDNVSFLANPPACRVYHSIDQSVANNTETSVAFNSERYDTNTMHDTATNNNRITFNTAGIYVVTFTGLWVNASDFTVFDAIIRLNGATRLAINTFAPTATNTNYGITLTTVYKFAAADWIEVRVRQVNTPVAARNLLFLANYSPEFAATWIGLG